MDYPLPSSIREINSLPRPGRVAVYKQLIPEWVFVQYGIDADSLLQAGQQVVRLRCPDASRSMELSIRHHPHELDPIFYLNMVDTFNNQIMVLLLVANDPDSPRFNIDVDLEGHPTHFGTSSRNLPEERRAMEAGLSPGQIRRGLRMFRSSAALFEGFIQRMGHRLYLIEPLFYHNAIIFERYGFAYTHGQVEMQNIHQHFLPGGDFQRKLNGSSPFRQPEAAQTVRGRSWAIHDGLLGHPFTGFQMYKRIGEQAGISTAPGIPW
jgi:hypothetical protein